MEFTLWGEGDSQLRNAPWLLLVTSYWRVQEAEIPGEGQVVWVKEVVGPWRPLVTYFASVPEPAILRMSAWVFKDITAFFPDADFCSCLLCRIPV